MGVLRLFFSFFGRINRAKFWLALAIIYAWWGAVMAAWYAFLPHDDLGNGTVGVLMIAGVVSFFSVMAKRLHDLGQTAWWIVAASGVLVLGDRAKDETSASITSALLFVAVIVLGSMKGKPGANKFGPDPLEDTREMTPKEQSAYNKGREFSNNLFEVFDN